MLNEIIVDVFAGGGGASSSIACAVGRSVDVAIDHDPAAIVMHRANHPHTKHLLQPIGGYTMNLEGKIVFISGAITGVDGYRKIFAAAEQWLLEQDCTVLNPAVLPPSGLEWDAYLRITTAMVREADAIYVLQNWEHSKGVREELALAAQLGKEIIYEPREAVIV